MNYEIVELEGLSGDKCKIYSVQVDGSENTLFDAFLEENEEIFPDEVNEIFIRLETIGNNTGARIDYFKPHEGRYGDCVCALYDREDSNIRLFCIRYGNATIILGGGGYKPKEIRAWQEDEKLNEEGTRMMDISAHITQKLKSGEIEYNGIEFKFQSNG